MLFGRNSQRTGTLKMNNRYFSIVILILVLCIPVGLTLLFSAEVMLRYVFFWPFFMSIFWIAGSVFFWF